jgi:hypothetical protein
VQNNTQERIVDVDLASVVWDEAQFPEFLQMHGNPPNQRILPRR